jgi:hypothetical protein
LKRICRSALSVVTVATLRAGRRVRHGRCVV